jgi:hypothetical protein
MYVSLSLYLSLHHPLPIHAHTLQGDHLFSASADSTLKIFDLGSRKLRRSVAVCDLALSACATCADGKLVVLGSYGAWVGLGMSFRFIHT